MSSKNEQNVYEGSVYTLFSEGTFDGLVNLKGQNRKGGWSNLDFVDANSLHNAAEEHIYNSYVIFWR